MPEPSREHAVVIGAGVAGLLAARVLAGHFEHVTVLDRDTLPGDAEPRSGVPQGRHLHALLRSGLTVLDELFPGFSGDLRRAGAVEILAETFLWRGPYGWHVQLPDPDRRFSALSATRPLIENAIARRVRALPNVEVRDEITVTGLLSGPGRVNGVRWLLGDATGDGDAMPADLVVDASGRGSRAPSWLIELGYGAPTETIIDPGLGYASRLLQAPADALGGALAVFVTPKTGQPLRGGAALRVENDQWIVTLAGAGAGHVPTRDEGAYVSFGDSLADPVLGHLLRTARPVSPIVTHRGTTNRRRHFERLSRHPAGFLAFGDSVCAFNPIYGQGMSVAALCAARLDRALRRSKQREVKADRLYAAFRSAAQPAWAVATGADLAQPTTEGIRPPGTALVNRYMDAVARACCSSPLVRRQFVAVTQLTKPAPALFAPHVALATTAAAMSPRRRNAGSKRPVMLPATGSPRSASRPSAETASGATA